MEEFKDDTFHIKIQDGILFIDMLKEFVDFDDIDFGIKKRLEITGDRTFPFVSDMCAVKTATPAARKRMADKDGEYGVSAVALILRTRMHRILFNLFSIMYKKKIPLKVFRNKENAIKWVQQYRQIVPELEIEAINNNTSFK